MIQYFRYLLQAFILINRGNKTKWPFRCIWGLSNTSLQDPRDGGRSTRKDFRKQHYRQESGQNFSAIHGACRFLLLIRVNYSNREKRVSGSHWGSAFERLNAETMESMQLIAYLYMCFRQSAVGWTNLNVSVHPQKINIVRAAQWKCLFLKSSIKYMIWFWAIDESKYTN